MQLWMQGNAFVQAQQAGKQIVWDKVSHIKCIIQWNMFSMVIRGFVFSCLSTLNITQSDHRYFTKRVGGRVKGGRAGICQLLRNWERLGPTEERWRDETRAREREQERARGLIFNVIYGMWQPVSEHPPTREEDHRNRRQGWGEQEKRKRKLEENDKNLSQAMAVYIAPTLC